MVRLDLLAALPPVKVEWRSVSVADGEQFVMISGVQQMQELSADS